MPYLALHFFWLDQLHAFQRSVRGVGGAIRLVGMSTAIAGSVHSPRSRRVGTIDDGDGGSQSFVRLTRLSTDVLIWRLALIPESFLYKR